MIVHDPLERLTANDARAAEVIDFLRSEGAGDLGHGGTRTLLAHLVGCYEIVRRWEQSTVIAHAALIHSVYGTDAYDQALIPRTARDELAAVAGERAERLGFLFASTPRAPLLAGTYRWLPLRSPIDDPPARDELDALVLLHMVNLAEQARARDGSPGRWLARLGDLAELLEDADGLTAPAFTGGLVAFADPHESLLRRSYRDGVGRTDDRQARLEHFALAAAVCPVVAEPCVWLAYLSPPRGRAAAWGACARERLLDLGTAWDKRLRFEEWLTLIDAAEEVRGVQLENLTHPRALFEAVAQRRKTSPRAAVAGPGRERFYTYVEELALGDGKTVAYPDLPSHPWHDPAEFPLVNYLESNYPAIRDEILGLERFQRESESIRRSGDWDVAFLYERGRRHDETCAACPVTTRGIESYPTVRTSAGLIYVSRMRGSTHIAAHRGPTNLRLRCHLGIKVPDGDCAIRVGAQKRTWEEGRCLIFDDFFEHEAWNHTPEDRIVLIIDLWHPGLSATEVSLLEGLHNFTSSYARRLARYWARNASAAQET